MTTRGDDGERRGRPRTGLGVGEQAEGDAGEGDVAHAVADEREPALDEEDADEGRGEPDEDARRAAPAA